MSIFGWSYPPGVSSVPRDEDWVADLTPYITLRGDADGVYWDEASEKAPQTSDAPAFARPDTDAFKRWFGDSKVVDKYGKPLVVYHGTAGEFNVFEPSQYGATKGGIFFTPDKATADAFANLAYENGNGDANTMAVYLAIRNPKVIEAAEIMDGKEHSFEREFAAVKKARDEGFDGLHIRNVPDQYRVADQWVAFRPEQIKSATGNRGTFDPNNPDVRF